MFIRLAVVVAIFYLLIYSGVLDFGKLSEMVKSGWIYCGAACFLVSTLVSIIRWRILLHAVHIYPTLIEVAKLSFIGHAFSIVIPGAISGDIIKAYYVAHGRSRKTEAIVTVILDRVMGLFTMLVTAALAIGAVLVINQEIAKTPIELRNIQIMGLILIFLIAGMVIGFLLSFSVRIRQSKLVKWLIMKKTPRHNIINKLYNGVYLFREKKRVLLIAIGFSFVGQFPLILSIYFFGKSADDTALRLAHYFFLGPIAMILNAIPLGPGGLGSGEAFVYTLFKLYGSNNGANITGIFHLLLIIFSVIGFSIYIWGKKEIANTVNATFEYEKSSTP